MIESVISRKKLSRTLEVINKMLELCKNPYLSLSFGKDSLVMLDLVYSVKKIPCYFLKSEESDAMFEYDELEKIYKDRGVDIKVIQTNRLTENDFDWNKARKAGNKDMDLLNKFNNHDGFFMGLRAEESKQRYMTLFNKKNNVIHDGIMEYKSGSRVGKLRCCPIARWTGFEVMTYLREKELPYLKIYEKEGEKMRTTARLTGDFVRCNGLVWIKKNHPERYNKLITLIPEMRIYT